MGQSYQQRLTPDTSPPPSAVMIVPAVPARAFGRENCCLRGARQIAKSGRKAASLSSAQAACSDDAQGCPSPQRRARMPRTRKRRPGAPLSPDPHSSHRQRCDLTILITQQHAAVGEGKTSPRQNVLGGGRRDYRRVTESFGSDLVFRQTSPSPVEFPEWRLHDLRRTATTGMASLNFPPHVVDKVLNHVSGTIRGVAAVYNRFEYLGERRAALQAWGEHIQNIVMPQPSNISIVGR